MKTLQPGVLAPVPPAARYLNFSLKPRTDPRKALGALAALADGENCVAGIGESVLRALGIAMPGMRPFPSYAGAGFEVPATPAALWCWLRGSDRGALPASGAHRSQRPDRVNSLQRHVLSRGTRFIALPLLIAWS
jgi:putative iron-dependent peroxidase